MHKFSHAAHSGIHYSMLNVCLALQEEKYANAMRFQIVAGRLYLDFTQFRAPERQLGAHEVPYWFPADVRSP